MLEGLQRWVECSPQMVTLALGALPVFELRAAIPAGVFLGLTISEAYLWACAGNLLPVVPLLVFLEPVSERLRRFPGWRGFFDWLFTQTAHKGQIIQRYEALGLALFVMVPLPGTGAWTGCVAASLFKLPFRMAFLAIALGILCAGAIVALALQLGLTLFYTPPS